MTRTSHAKLYYFVKKYFWQLPLLRVLKIKRCFQKVQCLYVVKLKFGQLQPTFLNLSSNFMKLLWVKGFHILLNTILRHCKQQVNLFVLKKITSKYLGIKSTTQKYKNTATILLTVWKSHGMHYGEYAVHCFLTIHMELETLVMFQGAFVWGKNKKFLLIYTWHNV